MLKDKQNHYLRRCHAKSKKVQVFNEVIQDLARIQSNGSQTRPGFRPMTYPSDPSVRYHRVCDPESGSQTTERHVTVFERSENPLSIRVSEVRMMKRIFSEMLFLAIFSQINQEGFLCNPYYNYSP